MFCETDTFIFGNLLQHDIEHQMETISVKKSELSFARKIFLGVLTGLWMALAGCFSFSVAGLFVIFSDLKIVHVVMPHQKRFVWWCRWHWSRGCRADSYPSETGKLFDTGPHSISYVFCRCD